MDLDWQAAGKPNEVEDEKAKRRWVFRLWLIDDDLFFCLAVLSKFTEKGNLQN